MNNKNTLLSFLIFFIVVSYTSRTCAAGQKRHRETIEQTQAKWPKIDKPTSIPIPTILKQDPEYYPFTMLDPRFRDFQLETGELYERIGKNHAAFFYYSLAATQGSLKALLRVAMCYYKGCGVPKNETRAQELLQKAADQDYLPALKMLAKEVGPLF